MRSGDLELSDETREMQRALWVRAELLVDALPGREALEDALRPLVTEFVRRRPNPSVPVGAGSFSTSEAELTEALLDLLNGRQTDGTTVARAAAWILAGATAARELLDGPPSRASIEALHEGGRFPWEFLLYTGRALVGLLTRDRVTRTKWLGFLEATSADLVSELTTDIGPGVAGRAEQWRKETDPFAVFAAEYQRGGYGWSRAVEWTVTRLRLLLMIAPDRFPSAIDRLPIPHLMWSSVQLLQLHEDAELIISMIRTAPPVWSDAGEWTRSVAVLLFGDLIFDHLQAVRTAAKHGAEFPHMPQNEKTQQRKTRAAERQRALESSELKEWATGAFGALLQRPDGQRVAFEQSARLARVRIIGEWGHAHGEWSATQTTLDAASMALANQQVSPLKFREWWLTREATITRRKRREPNTSEGAQRFSAEGLPYVVAAVATLYSRVKDLRNIGPEDGQEEAERLWDWLSELFDGRDPGIELTAARNSDYAFRVAGYLLSSLVTPAEKWKHTFASLEAQRRRVWQRRVGDDFLPPHTSADLIWAGLFGGASWRRDDDSLADGAREFYFEVVERARFLYLFDYGNDLIGRAAAAAYTTCFAFAKIMLASTLVPDVVAMLRPVANDPVIMRDVILMIRRNDIADGDVASICSSLGIDEHENAKLADRISPPPHS